MANEGQLEGDILPLSYLGREGEELRFWYNENTGYLSPAAGKEQCLE